MKGKKKGCLIVLLGVLGFFIVVGVIMSMTMDKVKTGIAQHIDVTTEQGKEIDSILKKCGIENLKSASHDELLDNAHEDKETGYRLSTNETKNIILYLNSNKKVNSIRYADYDLYANNSVVANIQDYIITQNEASKYQLLCQEKVKEILKSPKSAKFPLITEWGMAKEKNIIKIQSYVDSQNSFGAELRSNFQLTVDTDDNTIKSFIFDGKELLKN